MTRHIALFTVIHQYHRVTEDTNLSRHARTGARINMLKVATYIYRCMAKAQLLVWLSEIAVGMKDAIYYISLHLHDQQPGSVFPVLYI